MTETQGNLPQIRQLKQSIDKSTNKMKDFDKSGLPR